MKFRANQTGFSIVELVIVLVVVAIIGALGYVYYNGQLSKTASNDSGQASTESTTASDVKSAPQINSAADLNSAETVLDQTDPGSSSNTDTGQLDAELANF